jgi:hypothetical protein
MPVDTNFAIAQYARYVAGEITAIEAANNCGISPSGLSKIIRRRGIIKNPVQRINVPGNDKRKPEPGAVYTIRLIGHVPAKKNSTHSIIIGGKRRTIYSRDSYIELDRLAYQIPPEVRDLKLIHPEIEFWITVPQGRSDRDNTVTSCLDLLVLYGVLVNDSIASCNGKMTIHPAVRGDIHKTIIKLTESEHGSDPWPNVPPRGPKKPRKKRTSKYFEALLSGPRGPTHE